MTSESKEPNNIIRKKWLRGLNGYARVPRQEFLLANGLMSDSEMLLYQLIRDVLSVWDKHKAEFGIFEFDPLQIEYFLGWTPDKAKRVFRNLRKLRTIETVESHKTMYRLIMFGRYTDMLFTGDLKHNRLKYVDQFCKVLKENCDPKDDYLHTRVAKLQSQLKDKIANAIYSDSKSSLSSNVYVSLKSVNDKSNVSNINLELNEPFDETTEHEIEEQFCNI